MAQQRQPAIDPIVADALRRGGRTPVPLPPEARGDIEAILRKIGGIGPAPDPVDLLQAQAKNASASVVSPRAVNSGVGVQKILGGDDPMGASALMMPGVTQFLSGSGVPQTLSRRIATNISTDELKSFLRRELNMPMQETEEVVNTIAKKYPRVMAHVNRWTTVPQDKMSKVHGSQRANQWRRPVSDIQLNPRTLQQQRGKEFNPQTADKLVDTLYHELTHAAQQLGTGGRLGTSYGVAERLWGYLKNPYEIAARWAAKRRGGLFGAEAEQPLKNTPVTVNKLLNTKTLSASPGQLNNAIMDQLRKYPDTSIDDLNYAREILRPATQKRPPR
jgi:hypothetical protein